MCNEVSDVHVLYIHVWPNLCAYLCVCVCKKLHQLVSTHTHTHTLDESMMWCTLRGRGGSCMDSETHN